MLPSAIRRDRHRLLDFVGRVNLERVPWFFLRLVEEDLILLSSQTV